MAIWCADRSPDSAQRANALAPELGLPITRTAEVSEFDLLLTVTTDRLELREPAHAHRAGFAVEFKQTAANLTRRQPLAKAFGKDVRTIIDTTAGWGRDSYLLTQLGYCVTAVERSPIVAALLRDGVARARLDGALTVIHADARTALKQALPKPDAVYVDPMYPPKKKKSARSRKGIELLRELVGSDEDASELFAQAMETATRRVIVKRADDAPQLAPNPTISFGGKTVRYDVYVTLGR